MHCCENRNCVEYELRVNSKVTGFNPLTADPTKWSNTVKKNRRQQPTNCLSVFDHFVGLAIEGLAKPFEQPLEYICPLSIKYKDP